MALLRKAGPRAAIRWHCNIKDGANLRRAELLPSRRGGQGKAPSWWGKKCQGRERTYVRIILLLVRGSCHGAVSGLDFSCLHKAHNAVGIHV